MGTVAADHPFFPVRPEDVVLEPSPVPSASVLAGAPVARSGTLSRPSGDGISVGVWECSAGSFTYPYYCDETVMITSGSVRVTDPAGRTTVLREGDWATFTAGETAVWEIDDHVRKVWVIPTAGRLHSRLLLRARVLVGRTARRRRRVKPAAAALGGSMAGVVCLVVLLPI